MTRHSTTSNFGSLNSRDSLREKAALRHEPGSFMHLTPMTGSVTSDPRLYGGIPPLAVTIHTDTVLKTDYLDSPTGANTAPPALGRYP
ncbi:hypothetical protein VNI00_002418 [Paramarasmius palmivorus]|uniref:Uncharacterized protein n=1 Tax=Paramarasmius palmivorus TaxID=297713 RepID=A0AAW0DXK2_9AGAR